MRQILLRAVVLGVGAVTLSACGQAGALYLPSGAATAQRATLPQSLRPDDSSATPAAAASTPQAH